MRNVFDQYDQPENRLTHALGTCLSEDPALLADFLAWLKVVPPLDACLQVVEQQLPGNAASESAEQVDRRLPDAWIYTSGWALLVESKVGLAIDYPQLRGHLAIAGHRGFGDARLLVLSIDAPTTPLPDRCLHRRWSDVYAWASAASSRSRWAAQLAHYLPIAEQRMVDLGYLKQGTLTRFTGIPFDGGYPYDYFEAKRLLRLLMLELRADARLDALGAERSAPGRKAIKNTVHGVWDALPLGTGAEYLTASQHLSLVIQRDRVIAHVTWPNALDGAARRRLADGGYAAFEAATRTFVENAGRLLAEDAGCTPFVAVLQRHSLVRSGEPVRDAVLEFDPRTAVGSGPIKRLDLWLRTAFEAYLSREANVHLEIGLAFAYGASGAARAPAFADTLVRTYLATQPLLALTEPQARVQSSAATHAA